MCVCLSLPPSHSHKHTHEHTGTKKIWNLELHDKKVQTVSCSPVSSHYMVTASLDRSVRLWDLRKLAKAKKTCKAVWTYNDSRSVNCAFFDNCTGSSIVTVSQSDQVRLFSDPTSALSGDHVRPTHSVRHNNQTGRYLTVRFFFLFSYSITLTINVNAGVSRMLETQLLRHFCHGLYVTAPTCRYLYDF